MRCTNPTRCGGRAAAAALWLTALLCSPRNIATAEGPALSFPLAQGWEGADAAYSIPLGGGRSLWLFGDTLVGPPDDTRRAHVFAMPRNSVGITECPPRSACSITYAWAGKGGTAPRAFFDTGTRAWYWPQDGVVWRGRLFVMLLRLRSRGDGPFGFESTGVELATIPNYRDAPDRWRISYREVRAGRSWLPGASLVLGRRYLYCFTDVEEAGGSSMVLTRLSLSALRGAVPDGQGPPLRSGWQYLQSGGRWRTWQPWAAMPTDARRLMAPGATEMTVRYDRARRRWLAVLPAPFPGSGALYSVAGSLAGPWSSPATLYRYPETERGSLDFTPDAFCYAAKEHPEFETPEFETKDALVLTYACNSRKMDEVMRNPRLYRPIVVTLPSPAR